MYEQLPHDKIAVGPGWIQACREVKGFADRAPYVLDMENAQKSPLKGNQLKGKGKAKADVKTAPQDPADCESEEENTRTDITIVQNSTPVPHEISPSPPTTVEECANGRVRFTEEDREWFFRYIRHKLQRKPDMSRTSLMEAVGIKAPHHSAKSWDQRCRTEWNKQYHQVREEIRVSLPPQSAPVESVVSTPQAAPSAGPEGASNTLHAVQESRVKIESDAPPIAHLTS